jgi:hypothetical protein
MEKKVIELDVKVKGEDKIKNVDKAVKEVEKSSKNIQKENKKTESSFDAVGQKIDSFSGGAISTFKNLSSTITSTFVASQKSAINFGRALNVFLPKGFKISSNAAKGFGVALVAAGIGLITLAIASLIEFFSNFEKGVKVVNTALNVLGGTINSIVNSFNKLLKGDFKGFFKDVADGAKSAYEETNNLFEAEEKLFKLQRDNIQTNARLNATLQEQERIVGDTTLSFEERLEAQEKINKASLELLENERKQIETEQELLRSQIALENNYSARRQLELQLEQSSARLIKTESDLLVQRERGAREARLIQEEQTKIQEDAEKKRAEQVEKRLEAERKERDERLKIEADYNKELENLRVQSLTDAEEKLRAETEIKLSEIRRKYGEETELEKELILQRDAELDRLRIEKEQKEADDELARIERIKAIQDEFEGLTELERLEKEENAKLAELEALDATEAEKQMIREAYSQKRNDLADQELAYQQRLDELLLQSKRQAFSNILGATASAFGEQSKLGKKFAIAQALFNTYQGVSGALTDPTVPSFFVRLANASTALVTGLNSVKQIRKTNFGGGGSTGGSTGGAQAVQATQAQSPRFNINEASQGNQIADALSEQNNRPVEAYVVSSNMRSREALDRNIEESATIG